MTQTLMKALVADDDADIRALVAAVMRDDGYEVIEASDGADMVGVLESMAAEGLRPDVVIVDLLMPGLSGFSILRVLCRDRWSVPVLAITALGPGAFHDYARRLGASGTLRKPFGADEVRRAVASARVAHEAKFAWRARPAHAIPPDASPSRSVEEILEECILQASVVPLVVASEERDTELNEQRLTVPCAMAEPAATDDDPPRPRTEASASGVVPRETIPCATTDLAEYVALVKSTAG